MNRVVITGMGVVSSLGNTPEELFSNIIDQRCGIQKISHFDTSDFKVKLASEVKTFDEYIFKEGDCRFNDRYVHFARLSARDAVLSAKLHEIDFNHDRFGVVFGSGMGGLNTYDRAYAASSQNIHRISPYFIPMTILNSAGALIAIDHQAYGSNIPIVSGCATGTDAIGEAYLKIKHQQLDIVIAGASEASITRMGVGGFMALRAMYEGEDIRRSSIPFDLNRSGFVIGEGSGALILESLTHALNRNAPILAEVIGYGASCDAHHITAPDPEGKGLIKAMHLALQDAQLNPHQIDYINAHGTGTKLNDQSEAKAIKKVFNDHPVFVSSTKSHLGHMQAACGVVEAIICIKTLEKNILPMTIHTEGLDPSLDINVILHENKIYKTQFVMSNSLGFGGHNASLIFKKWV